MVDISDSAATPAENQLERRVHPGGYHRQWPHIDGNPNKGDRITSTTSDTATGLVVGLNVCTNAAGPVWTPTGVANVAVGSEIDGQLTLGGFALAASGSTAGQGFDEQRNALVSAGRRRVKQSGQSNRHADTGGRDRHHRHKFGALDRKLCGAADGHGQLCDIGRHGDQRNECGNSDKLFVVVGWYAVGRSHRDHVCRRGPARRPTQPMRQQRQATCCCRVVRSRALTGTTFIGALSGTATNATSAATATTATNATNATSATNATTAATATGYLLGSNNLSDISSTQTSQQNLQGSAALTITSGTATLSLAAAYQTLALN